MKPERSKSKLARACAGPKDRHSPDKCSGTRSGTELKKGKTRRAFACGSCPGARAGTVTRRPGSHKLGYGNGLRLYSGHASWTLSRFGRVDDTARPSLLLCDYDFRRVPRMRPMMAVLRTIGLRPIWLRTDRTRRGWHVIIKLTRALQPAETVAVQALLGSDSRRESLNLMRAMSVTRRDPGRFWRGRWNLLFSSKLQD